MLYPLSYECLAFRAFFFPVGVARTTLHDLRRDAKSISRTTAELRKQPLTPHPGHPSAHPLAPERPKPRTRGTGLRDGAEAEGFEPSMGFKTQTALAVRRHRPD